MYRGIAFHTFVMALASGGAAVFGALPVGADPLTAPSATLEAPASAAATAPLVLVRTTYGTGNFNGSAIPAGKAYTTGSPEYLPCPSTKCTVEFTGYVQVQGPGGGNNINLCSLVDNKEMPNCIIDGQETGGFESFTARQILAPLGKGTHKVQGFVGTAKGVKVYAYVYVWRIYE